MSALTSFSFYLLPSKVGTLPLLPVGFRPNLGLLLPFQHSPTLTYTLKSVTVGSLDNQAQIVSVSSTQDL